MRIAIESQRLFRPHKHGIEVSAYELLRRLPLAGDKHDYHIIVKEGKDKCLTHVDSRTVHTMKAAPYPVWEQALLPAYCKQMKADLLHCTASTAPICLKQPLLLTLHDLIFLEQNYPMTENWYQTFGNKYRSAIVQTIARKAMRIITVSHFQKNIIADQLHIPREKISVIYNGVDDRFFIKYSDVEIGHTLDKYKLQKGYIFFMANTDIRKNTVGVLHAYSLLLQQYQNAPRLLIKGLSKEQLHKHLRQEKLTSIAGYIDTVDYINYTRLPHIYQGASMFWYPSFSEGFGLPIIEAMASGVPVITSDASCMPEIAGNAALLIDPYKPNTITNAAIKILDDKTISHTLSRNGKSRSTFFTWNQSVKQLVQVYNEIENII